MPTINHILETCIYGPDMAAMEKFYCDLFGFRKVSDFSSRGFTLRVSPQNVLLIFDPRETRKPDARVPSHGAEGSGHVAFSIEPDELYAWRSRLKEKGILIEREVTWDGGAKSIYFRDPAGNSVELMAGDFWPA